MVNKNIIKIRKELDKLDNSLLKIIKKRIYWVDRVLKNKKYKKDIVDKKRIKIILSNIQKKSKNNKIDTMVTKKIWKSMIQAFIDYEFRNFDKIVTYYEAFFSTKNCVASVRIIFLSFNLSLAFLLLWVFSIINKFTIWIIFRYILTLM